MQTLLEMTLEPIAGLDIKIDISVYFINNTAIKDGARERA